MITIDVVSDLEESFDSIQRELDNLTPFWHEIIRRDLPMEYAEVFNTRGRGTWAPTQRSNPILRDTGRLYRSYTQAFSADNIARVDGDEVEYGTFVPYAEYVERHRPITDLVSEDLNFQRQVAQRLDAYIQERINDIS